MRMVLGAVGIKMTEKKIAALMETTKKHGTWNKSFPELAEKMKLSYIVARNSSIRELKSIKKQGYLIIVGYFHKPENMGHYAVVKKISGKTIYLFDPFEGFSHYYFLEEFDKIWRNDPKGDNEKRWFFGVKS